MGGGGIGLYLHPVYVELLKSKFQGKEHFFSNHRGFYVRKFRNMDIQINGILTRRGIQKRA